MQYDFAMPATGPMKLSGGIGPHSIEIEKYLTYNTSMRSKNDLNMNPQPEGNVSIGFSHQLENREGVYAIQTDRGSLYPTIETQVNFKGSEKFVNRLQDPVKPTMKDTLLHTHNGNIGNVIKNPTDYSQFLPTYVEINGKKVQVSGYDNYGLKTALEHSYIPGPATTGLNNNVIQDPDVVYNNVWKRPDNNSDGPGTLAHVSSDTTRSQMYTRITEPTSTGNRLTYNLESGNEVEMFGQRVSGIEERFTASYQITPLLNNPLHKIWNPNDSGEIPAFYCDGNAADYSYIHQTRLPEDSFMPGNNNSNSYLLNLGEGLHNERIEWEKSINNKPGVIYTPDSMNPGKCYSSARSVEDIYDSKLINYQNNTYTTLGDPTAGFINVR